MATTAIDQTLKVWDIRKLEGPLQSYKLRATPNNINFSQKHLLAVGMGNVIEVYRYVGRHVTFHVHLVLIIVLFAEIAVQLQQENRIWCINSILP